MLKSFFYFVRKISIKRLQKYSLLGTDSLNTFPSVLWPRVYKRSAVQLAVPIVQLLFTLNATFGYRIKFKIKICAD